MSNSAETTLHRVLDYIFDKANTQQNVTLHKDKLFSYLYFTKYRSCQKIF